MPELWARAEAVAQILEHAQHARDEGDHEQGGQDEEHDGEQHLDAGFGHCCFGAKASAFPQ